MRDFAFRGPAKQRDVVFNVPQATRSPTMAALNPLGLLLSLTDSVARELAAVREREARLQAKCDQDEERRQEALDALEMAQDRLASAEPGLRSPNARRGA
jgi:hypothetical protein